MAPSAKLRTCFDKLRLSGHLNLGPLGLSLSKPAFLLAVLLAVLLAACAPQPQSAHPALWEVTGPNGQKGWLFGTIHSLERPVAWRSATLDAAFADADSVVVEVAGLADDAAMRATFARLARTPGLPPLSRRVEPSLRPALARLLDKAGTKESAFADVETWAAALMLARAGASDKSGNGIDRAVIAAAGRKPVIELEGAAAQLSIFDRLPEKEQRDLLALAIADGDAVDNEAKLADAWREGDFAAIERETREGLLADPELRAALFTGRNRTWSARLAAMMRRGERPFVAVGAAHMAGADGLPALLEAGGYAVRRMQ